MLSTDQIKELLAECYRYASAHSTDPSTQNGALIIADGTLVYGANHFPRNVKELPARWERPLKYSFVEHAERNAIYSAAARGVMTQGCTMICTWYACADCARAIIQAGIKQVIGHKQMMDLTPPHWKQSIDVAFSMFDEANVNYSFFDGKIFPYDNLSIRMNGQLFFP